MRENIVHTVQKGDTLYQISKQYQVSVDEIKEINQLKNNLLTLGQQLIIKKDDPASSIEHVGSDICGTYQEESQIQAEKYSTYIVQKNDNLYSLAKKFDTTVSDLIYINSLDNQMLSIGQVLKVPYTEESMISYIVQPGDTLYKIASNYNVSVEALMKGNNMSSTVLKIGDVLQIPTSLENGNTTTPSVNEVTYTVKAGDTLYKIASNYQVSVADIMNQNQLSSTNLSIGQTLKIRKNSYNSTPTFITYSVKKGDNLYGIASKYNTTVAKIKSLNQLSSNLLSIGQVLKIPTS